jgi:hypothetical protein
MAREDAEHPSVPVADGCMNCGARMIVGGDHDCEDEEEYLMVTNASCPNCSAFLLFYTPRDEEK